MLVIERLLGFLADICRDIDHKTSRQDILGIVAKRIGNEGENGFSQLLSLIGNVEEEVANCELRRKDRRDSYLKTLDRLKGDLIASIVSEDKTDLWRWMHNCKHQLNIMAASVTEALDAETYDLDRPAFVSHTLELIEDANEWPIDEYAKRNLILSLNLVCQQAQAEASSSSDAEVRRKIKLIVASFALEFAELDKEFETRWEKIKRWAKLGYQGSSIPLGLTSDAAKVVGLLPKP